MELAEAGDAASLAIDGFAQYSLEPGSGTKLNGSVSPERKGCRKWGLGCLALSVVGALVLGAVAVWIVFRALMDFGGGATGETPYDNRHYYLALAAQHQHQTDVAIREWQAMEASGGAEISTRPLVECLKDRSRYQEALDTLERNKSMLSTSDYLDLRARVLEQWKGLDAAVAFLKEFDAAHPTPYGIERLGAFHLFGGRPRESLEPFLEAVRRACSMHAYGFDEHDQFVDAAPRPTSDASREAKDSYRSRLGQLTPSLEYLAMAYELLGDDEQAFRWATREVSLGQRLMPLSWYSDARELECGSLTGRIMRARIFLRRGQLDEAEAELDLASVMHESRAIETDQRLSDAKTKLAELREQAAK